MNNAKRRNIVLVKHYKSRQNSAGFRQRIARYDIHSVEIFETDFAAIESTPSKIMFYIYIHWSGCFRIN